jgi:hypothetical protein
MWEYLSRIDPNVVFGVISTIGGLLWHKSSGNKAANLRDTLWAIVEGNALKLAESATTIADARSRLAKAAQDGLGRLGLKRSAAVDKIVADLVERGLTEIRKRIIQRQLAGLAKATEGVVGAFAPAVVK